jgi:hypothetical protein
MAGKIRQIFRDLLQTPRYFVNFCTHSGIGCHCQRISYNHTVNGSKYQSSVVLPSDSGIA